MKTLSQGQYQWLLAIKRGDIELSYQLAEHLPEMELFNRGLYTGATDPDNLEMFEYNTIKLTTAGLIAIECYQVIHGIIMV